MRTSSNSGGCFGTALGMVIFGAVGLGLLIAGVLSYNRATAMRNWPTVEGTITSAEIYESRDEDGTSYGVNVSYGYVVEDRPYTGSRISLTDYSSSRRYAVNLKDKYDVGTKVTVHYNPADPMDSVLEPGANWVQYLLLGMGCCFSVIPLLMLPSLFRQRGF